MLHNCAAESFREFLGDLTKSLQHPAPSLVARGSEMLRRGDDVGEQHGAQGPMRLRRRRMATGEELLDLGQDRVGLGEPRRMVCTVDLEKTCVRDVVGEVAAALHRAWRHRGHGRQGWAH